MDCERYWLGVLKLDFGGHPDFNRVYTPAFSTKIA